MGVPINYNLRNLIERKGTTLMTAVGIGLTVAVLVVALALTAGLKQIFAGTGDPRHLIVLRKGVDAELSSTVSNDAYQIIRRLPGIATTQAGEPMVSPEGLTVINLPSVDSPEGMNVTVRGLLPIGISAALSAPAGGLSPVQAAMSIAWKAKSASAPQRRTRAARSRTRPLF